MSDFELIITHGAGTLTLTNANSLMAGEGVEYIRDENHPARLSFRYLNGTASTTNILNSAFAGWTSGSGALTIGDRVTYSVYPTSTGVKTQIFYGKVIEVALGSSEKEILVNCLEDWEEYDHLDVDTIYFNSYRDLSAFPTGVDTNEKRTITSVTDANIVLPMSVVQLLSNDQADFIGANDDADSNYITATAVGQAFYAKTEWLIGVNMKFYADGTFPTNDVYCMIYSDTGGLPGTLIATSVIPSASIARDSTFHLLNFSFVDGSSHLPLNLTPGKKYWATLTTQNNTLMTSWRTRSRSNATVPTDILGVVARVYGTWGSTADTDHALFLETFWGEYADQSSTKQSFDDSTNVLTLNAIDSPRNSTYPSDYNLGWESSLYRGRLSYYYGTKAVSDILLGLVGLGSLTPSVDAAKFVKTVGIYRTRGKSIGECLRELCDLRETWGAWDSSQHCVAQSPTAGTLYFKRRLNLNASSAFTFSHGFDTSTDSEKRIIDGSVQLTKTSRAKPTWVKVIGRGTDGLPIVAVVHDKEMTTPLSTKLGHSRMETIQDDSIQTLTDARNAAKAYLESVKDSYDAWEGRLTISGVYPDLFDLDTASDTFGSGKIITLNYSPLGISAVKFKVTGIKLLKNKTEIQLSSQDVLINNRFLDVAWSTERNESFVSPTDPQTNVMGTGHLADTYGFTPGVMGLYAGSVISSYVPISYITDATLGLSFVHAEFEAGDGVTASGTPIDRVLVRQTSSGPWKTIMLDVPLYKWKTTRCIIDVSAQD